MLHVCTWKTWAVLIGLGGMVVQHFMHLDTYFVFSVSFHITFLKKLCVITPLVMRAKIHKQLLSSCAVTSKYKRELCT